MIGALLGPDAIRYAVVYDQLGSFFALATYGLIVVARFSGGGAPSRLATACSALVKFPPFVALLLALLPFPHPALLDRRARAYLGDTLVPIAMFAVGLKLELRPPSELRAFAYGLDAEDGRRSRSSRSPYCRARARRDTVGSHRDPRGVQNAPHDHRRGASPAWRGSRRSSPQPSSATVSSRARDAADTRRGTCSRSG